MNIKKRLYLGFGILIVIMLGFVLLSVGSLNKISENANYLSEHPYAVRSTILRVDTNIIKIHRAMKDLVLSESDEESNALIAKITNYEAEIYHDIAFIRERFHGDPSEVRKFEVLFSKWKPIREVVIYLKKQGDVQKAFVITRREGDAHVDKLENAIDKFISSAEERADLSYRESVYENQSTIINIYILLIVALIIAVIFSGSITRSISNPLRKLQQGAEIIGSGNLKYRIDAKRKDEIGDLAGSFNKMANDLRNHMDILEIKSNELKESEEKYREFVEGTDDLITQVDANGDFLYLNHAAEKVLGLKPEECIGKSSFAFIHPDDRADTQESFKLWTQNKLTIVKHENRQINKNGETSHMLWNMNLHYDEKGDLKLVNSIARDITSEIIAQSEKEELWKQLFQSQKMETLGLLSGRVAHDFNNLLTPIIGFSSIIYADLPDGSPDKDMAARISDTAQKASSLIDQLLTFSRSQELKRSTCNLNPIISDMRDLLASTVGEGVSLKLPIDTRVNNIFGNITQIQQVILNLAVNAKQAMPSGGTLSIDINDDVIDDEYVREHRGAKKGDYVVLSITDTGEGMSPEVKLKIFDPFFTTKEKGKGTGLGLSTVYEIVKQHDGYISVHSELGKGTCFKVYFPVDLRTIEKEAKEEVRINVKGNETVLVVDDKTIILQMLGEILRSNGYSVLEAPNAEEAIKALSEHKDEIALLITDVAMPGMNGWELYQKIKKDKPEIQVLFTSGLIENPTVLHNIQEKGYPFIAKPLYPQELLTKIRLILDSA